MTAIASPTVVRIAIAIADAEALSDAMLAAPEAVSEQLGLQLWLCAVLLEQRRRTPRAERPAFDEQADRILQQLDPMAVHDA